MEAQHLLFVEHFIETRNVREAAIASGYAPSHGYTLFKKNRDLITERLADELIMMQAEAIHVVKETMTKSDYIPAVQAQKMRAAETTMDRGSLTKKQNLEVGIQELAAVMILPAKDPVPPSQVPHDTELDD